MLLPKAQITINTVLKIGLVSIKSILFKFHGKNANGSLVGVEDFKPLLKYHEI